MKLRYDSAAFVGLSHDLLASGYRVRFRADGWSMRPAIRDGETVTIEPVLPSSVKEGDIVLLRQNGRPLVHRVVHVGMENGEVVEFIVRGDAKRACDAPVKPDDVLGRVTDTFTPRGWRSILQRWRLRAAPEPGPGAAHNPQRVVERQQG
jgi:signal peptidase I